MTQHLLRVVSAIAAICTGGCGMSHDSTAVKSETKTLPNGLRIVAIPFAKSGNVSIFTYLPLGLAGDGAGQTQWSHLIEHLVIRTTMPGDLSQGNAETLPDHMRLDFYGTTANWQEGLSHHQRWLEGIPFSQANLDAEKPRVVAECDSVAKNLATHKFAMSAWAQGVRFGRPNVTIKGDVLKAELAAVQKYRNERLMVPAQTTVCVVGGVDAATVFAEVEKQLGGLRSGPAATTAPPAPARAPTPGNLDLTWDLDARHILLTWPLPDAGTAEHAALTAASVWLNMRFFEDTALKPLTGMVACATDLTTPEGSFFCVSTALRPGAEADAVRKKLLATVGRLAAGGNDLKQLPMLGQQLAFQLTRVPDSAALAGSTPPGMKPAMVEANIGLQSGMHVQRFGAHREEEARHLSRLTATGVQQAAARFLTEAKCQTCTLQPAH